MERLKDFFYNKNDILVALAIILLAGLLIFGRMNVIMDYPAFLAAQQAEQNNPGPNTGISGDGYNSGDEGQGSEGSQDGTGDEGQGSEGSQDGTGDEGQSGEGSQGGTGDEGQGGEGSQTGSNEGQGSTGPATGTSVKFTVKGNSTWKSVSEDLQKAGLISSADEFYKVALKLDTKKELKTLYPGDYFIVSGSDAEAIISTLTTR